MKLKEYWPSWQRERQIKRLSLSELKIPAVKSVPVIVSLTSIPSRLAKLHLTIRSLLIQSVQPEKILLWLHHDLASQIPAALKDLQGDIFEIHYVDLTCSHRKLIHSLTAFPHKVIVTCDDDLMYNSSWLERLYLEHQKFPLDVIAHECRRITRDEQGELLPYKEWPTLNEPGIAGMDLLAIGYGGVLYPPGSLSSEAINVDLFLKLAPKADDLWFKAMSFLNGVKVRRSSEPRPKPIEIIGSQKISLLKSNVREDFNRQQWSQICNYYGISV